MSESEIPVNPHGDYHEEDDSKLEDIRVFALLSDNRYPIHVFKPWIRG